jgi:GTP-binding protein Era
MNKYTNYCGFITLIGRPNVGKSTLLNRLIGKKISITSSKPQTTLYRIKGIQTVDRYQTIYVDTPGVSLKSRDQITRKINCRAIDSLSTIDLAIFVVEGNTWNTDDTLVVDNIRDRKIPIILAINKSDQVKSKEVLLPHIESLSNKLDLSEVVIISAKSGEGIDRLSNIIQGYLPRSDHLFPQGCITDCSQSFMISEIIREQLFRLLGAELPYCLRVKLENFNIDQFGNQRIFCLILVQRNSQKKIVIGNNGIKIKEIGEKSRRNIEKLLGSTVYLNLWVQVKRFNQDKDSSFHDTDI